MAEVLTSQFPDKKVATVDYDRVTRHITETKALYKEADVGQKEATWMFYGEYPDIPVAFTYMPDIHYGSMHVDYDLLNKHMGIVEDTPNMAIILGGDMTDNFSPKHIPEGMLGDGVSPELQTRAFMGKLLDLDQKSKIGAICFGNHDDWTFRSAGMDYYNTFMGDFQAPIFGKGGTLQIFVGEGGQRYQVGINHTHWGNSKINPTNAAKRAMEYSYPDSDIGLLGHVHVSAGEQYDRGGNQKIAVIGGTYKVDDSFSAKWGMGVPGRAGYTIMMWPNEKKMQLFREPEDAAAFIKGAIQTKAEGGDWEDPYSEMIRQSRGRDQARIEELQAIIDSLKSAS